MDCPKCKEPMLVVELDRVEIDCCPSCQGIWLDADEIDLLHCDRERTRAFLQAGDRSRAAKEELVRCPICRKKMDKGVTGGKDPVVYDSCPRGHGMWFDEGELASVLCQCGAKPDNPVFAWLHGMYGGAEDGTTTPQQGEGL